MVAKRASIDRRISAALMRVMVTAGSASPACAAKMLHDRREQRGGRSFARHVAQRDPTAPSPTSR
jgi:hypothetical protein